METDLIALDEHVADIRAFIARVVPREELPILVGHSFGGMYAQKVCLPLVVRLQECSRGTSPRVLVGKPVGLCSRIGEDIGRNSIYRPGRAASTAAHPGGAFIRRHVLPKHTSPHAQKVLSLRMPHVWPRAVWLRVSHTEKIQIRIPYGS